MVRPRAVFYKLSTSVGGGIFCHFVSLVLEIFFAFFFETTSKHGVECAFLMFIVGGVGDAKFWVVC